MPLCWAERKMTGQGRTEPAAWALIMHSVPLCVLIEFPLLQYFTPAPNANFSISQQSSTIRWTDAPGQLTNQIRSL